MFTYFSYLIFYSFCFLLGLLKFASVNHRKKKHRSEVLSGAEDEAVEDEADHAINGESLNKKITSKKKSKRNEETNKENADTLDENVKDNVKGVEQASTTPDEAKKVF